MSNDPKKLVWPICHECCLELGAIASPWPVTCTSAVCTRCGKLGYIAAYSDYSWPNGDKATWD